MPTFGPALSSYRWMIRNLSASLLGRGMPCGRYRRFRYEAFVDQPGDSLRAMLALLDEPAAAAALPAAMDAVELPVCHSFSGNPMRFKVGAIAIRKDEAWRKELSARDRRLVTCMTWPLLKAWGFS